MRTLLFLTFVCALLAFSCTKDRTDPKSTIFTVNQPPQNASRIDMWVVVRDGETGELLDSKLLVMAGTTTFETPRSISNHKLSVTVAYSTPGPDFINICRISVFNGIDVGSEWTMSYEDLRTDGIITGPFSLSITGVPSVYAFNVSGRNDGLLSGTTYSNGTLKGDYDFAGLPRQLVSLDPGFGNPRYLWLEDVRPYDTITVDYSDLKEFDRYVNFKFPSTDDVNVYVLGYEGDPRHVSGYVLYQNEYWRGETQRDEINIGILDFPGYYFKVDVGTFHFFSIGSEPKAIEYTSNDAFTVSNANSITGYSVSATKDYLYSTSSYSYFEGSNNTRYSLTYYSPVGNAKQFEPLDDDLSRAFDFSMEKCAYNQTTFTLKGRPYTDMIDHLMNLKFGVASDPFEEIRVDVE